MNTHDLLINTQACLHVPKSLREGSWVGPLLGWFCLSEILLEESSLHVYFIVTKEPKRHAGSLTNHHTCCRDPNCTTSILLSCPSQSLSVFVSFSQAWMNASWVERISTAFHSVSRFFCSSMFCPFSVFQVKRRRLPLSGRVHHQAEALWLNKRPRLSPARRLLPARAPSLLLGWIWQTASATTSALLPAPSRSTVMVSAPCLVHCVAFNLS